MFSNTLHAQVSPPDAELSARVHKLQSYLFAGDLETFKQQVMAAPEITQPTPNRLFGRLMKMVVVFNDLDLTKWLATHCPDCELDALGGELLQEPSGTWENVWRGIDAETFAYIYENGGMDAFTRDYSEQVLLDRVVDYWIPEADGIYGDYFANEDDRKFEGHRREQRIGMLSYLLTNGHDINQVTGSGKTALFTASSNSDEAVVDFLIENGANAESGRNPLATITKNSTPSLLKKLLDLGFDPRDVTPYYFASPQSTILLGRLVEGRVFKPKLLELLEPYNIDVNAKDSHGLAAIDYASHEFGQDTQPYTDYLLKRGATKTDRYHYRTLEQAVSDSDGRLLARLLREQPNLHNRWAEFSKRSLLEDAVRSGSLETVDLLLDAGAALGDNDFYATRLFESALAYGHLDIAERILEMHPDVPVSRPVQTTVDGKEVTVLQSRALNEMSAKGNVEWTQRLLDRGASLFGIRIFDYPITGPALNGHIEIARMLLDAGSQANPVDQRSNESLLDMLSEDDVENAEMIALLREFAERR